MTRARHSGRVSIFDAYVEAPSLFWLGVDPMAVVDGASASPVAELVHFLHDQLDRITWNGEWNGRRSIGKDGAAGCVRRSVARVLRESVLVRRLPEREEREEVGRGTSWSRPSSSR